MDNNLQPEESVLVSPVKEKRKFYWPTRILFLLTALLALASALNDQFSLAENCLRLFTTANYAPFFYNTISSLSNIAQGALSPNLLMLICSFVFLLLAGKIKQNPRYCRWVGIAPLMLAVLSLLSLIVFVLYIVAVYWLSEIMTAASPLFYISSAAQFFFYLYLAVIFFSGTKKKTWLFVVALITALLIGVIHVYSTVTYAIYIVDYAIYILSVTAQMAIVSSLTLLIKFSFSCIALLCTAGFWAGLLSLMLPGKKAVAQTEIQ